jgi:hypothetical protein
MARVYVVQQGSARNPSTGEKKPFDFTAAADYGELVFLLSPTASPSNPEAICKELNEKLRDFTEQDFLVLVGGPALIGWATAIAAQYCRRVSLLQWSGKHKCYSRVISPLEMGCAF